MSVAADIELIRASRPCSVELPAGCGKTQLIAELAKDAAAKGERSLVLTHTHAGVDALRTRCRELGVPSASVTVRTIDSWCFDLISSFPQLSGIEVGSEPDSKLWAKYHDAGSDACDTEAVRKMLRLSYELVVVDEYQDCSIQQHLLVLYIADVVPTAVFGDRMQGLFFFNDNEPISWERHVEPVFPAVPVEVTPWRWATSNPDLGRWLLDARNRLMNGLLIDVASSPISLHPARDLDKACWAQPPHPARVAALAKMEWGCVSLAKRLQGTYSMIEELEGRALLKFANAVDGKDAPARALGVVEFAVLCASNVAPVFDAPSRARLASGKPLQAPRFDSVVEQRDVVNSLLTDSSPAAMAAALRALQRLPGVRLRRREAWHGVLDALRLASTTPDLSVRDAVVQVRNQLRVTGRAPESRILARPLLIKGLEFDHVVVTDPGAYNAHELYVCLTRGATSVSVVSDTSVFAPPRPQG